MCFSKPDNSSREARYSGGVKAEELYHDISFSIFINNELL